MELPCFRAIRRNGDERWMNRRWMLGRNLACNNNKVLSVTWRLGCRYRVRKDWFISWLVYICYVGVVNEQEGLLFK